MAGEFSSQREELAQKGTPEGGEHLDVMGPTEKSGESISLPDMAAEMTSRTDSTGQAFVQEGQETVAPIKADSKISLGGVVKEFGQLAMLAIREAPGRLADRAQRDSRQRQLEAWRTRVPVLRETVAGLEEQGRKASQEARKISNLIEQAKKTHEYDRSFWVRVDSPHDQSPEVAAYRQLLAAEVGVRSLNDDLSRRLQAARMELNTGERALQDLPGRLAPRASLRETQGRIKEAQFLRAAKWSEDDVFAVTGQKSK